MKNKNMFDHYQERVCKIWFDEKGYQTATEIVSDLIRCKDCKWYGDGYLCYNTETLGMQPDDYCSLAERKEE